MKKHFSIHIRGSVQGVFFRRHAKDLADRLGLHGWAKNLEDGSVNIEIEGDEPALHEFLQWCYKGSPASEVEQVEIEQGDLANLEGFDILH